jgi:hypothetical protein
MSALAGEEWPASRPGRFTPRAGMDDMEKLKFFTLPGLELRSHSRLARIQSLYQLSY